MTQEQQPHPKRWFGTLTHNGQKWAIVGGDDAIAKAKEKFGPGSIISATGCVGPLPVFDVDRDGPPRMDRPPAPPKPVDEIERQNAVDEERAQSETERQRSADAKMASRPKWGFGMVRSGKPKAADGPPAPATGPEADAKRLAKFANVTAPDKPGGKETT